MPEAISLQLHSTDRKGYRVKGLLNEVPIAQLALMPMGEGELILPVNAAMRKQLQQLVGATIQVRLTKDDTELTIAADLPRR